METVYMEHVNVTVENIDNTVAFFKTAFPHFEVRGGGTFNDRKWIHFGDEKTYLAINESNSDIAIQKGYNSSGINHVGFVVNDVDGIASRLLEAGFERDYPKQEERYRIRDYFADSDGNQYEFVQYLSEKSEERNMY